MKKEQTVQTIYLKDLIFAALYRWKWIVAAMLVFALLLGGLEFLQSNKIITLNTVSLTPENQIKVDQLQSTIEYTQQMIDRQSEYVENSVMLQLDPYAAYTAGKHYNVELLVESTEPLELSDAIIRSYAVTPSKGAAVEKVAQSLNLPAWAIDEMIFLRTDSGLQVIARGRTLEEAQTIAAAACADMEALQAQVSATVAAHNLTGVDFSKGPVMDTNLYDYQYGARQKLSTLKNNLVSAETELNKFLPTELLEGSAKPALFAAVGAVLGTGLMACIAWVAHIGSATVYSHRTLKDHTGVRVLGCFSGDRKYDGLTRWFRKLEGRVTHNETDAVAANIHNHCQQMNKLLLLGHYQEKDVAPLVAELTKNGITCVLCGDPMAQAQVFQELPQCDGVVLVETCGISRYDSVNWEMETVGDYNKALLGCVLIGG